MFPRKTDDFATRLTPDLTHSRIKRSLSMIVTRQFGERRRRNLFSGGAFAVWFRIAGGGKEKQVKKADSLLRSSAGNRNEDVRGCVMCRVVRKVHKKLTKSVK